MSGQLKCFYNMTLVRVFHQVGNCKPLYSNRSNNNKISGVGPGTGRGGLGKGELGGGNDLKRGSGVNNFPPPSIGNPGKRKMN